MRWPRRAWLLHTAPVMLAVLHYGFATAYAQEATAPTSPGSIGIQLLEGPVDREDDPRAHTYIIDFLAPGTVIHRKFQVVNTSKTTQHVDLYPGAASVGRGTFLFAPDHTANELTSWVSLFPTSRDLPPGGIAPVEATITVPRTASASERYAVIWAQDSSQPDHTDTIRMINRVGLRIYLDVGPGGEPPSDFQIKDMAATRVADGTPEVVVHVHNTGGRALDMTGSVELTNGPGSLSAGPFPAKLGTTLGIKDTERVIFPLNKRLPDGPWTVNLTLSSGLIHHDAAGTLTFPDTVSTSPPVKLESDSSKIGWTLGLGGGLIVTALAIVYHRLKP